MHKALAAVFLTASLLACSAGTDDAAEGGMDFANANCPLMGNPVEADGGSAEFKGHTIGFCCEGCAPKFEKLSETEKLAKLAEVGYTPGG